MLLSVTAFATETAASWSVFGGNADHNAVVGKAPTTDVTVTALKLLKPDSGWDGVDTVPLMQTVGNVTYAYVLYDGHADGCTLAKINCSANTPYVVWHKQLESKSGFQLSTPLLVQGSNDNSEADDVIYAASNSGAVYKITGLQASDTDATGVEATKIYTVSKGQINTPIVSYGDIFILALGLAMAPLKAAQSRAVITRCRLQTFRVPRMIVTRFSLYPPFTRASTGAVQLLLAKRFTSAATAAISIIVPWETALAQRRIRISMPPASLCPALMEMPLAMCALPL